MEQFVFASVRRRFAFDFVVSWIVWLLFLCFLKNPPIYLYIIGFLGFAIFLALFYKTTITVTRKILTFQLGLSFSPMRTTFEMSDIKACVPIDNPEPVGKGIMAKMNMAINRVLGVKAIELQFFSKDSVIQLETAQPQQVCDAVNDLLSTDGETIKG